ncbi:uncharacterized protein TNIN_32521 [Trichonephila inaurata madagascariensis]|uniref:LolA-like domain-containing protein n=1 Tax=Trichonephila inaurata madagascariensis TaxID=2747483 RepID=A0A8X7C763_9ARAC|nr:uncharacterized protein TNIN_32521 [Trichonephila inaurata madagascariensis]
MKDLIDFRKCAILIPVILFMIQDCSCVPQFTCPTREGDPLPDLFAAFSTNMRINYIKQQKSVDARQVVNMDRNQMTLELWADKRHVKYIQHGYQLLTIKYENDSNPTCTVQKLHDLEHMLEEEDSGPSEILEELSYVVHEHKSKFVISDVSVENGVIVKKWEACVRVPKMNVSLSFTEQSWKQGHTSALHKGRYLVSAEAQINDDFMVVLFNNLDPVMPPDTEFQPPENVYCEGFRAEKKPPTIKNYFNYDSELISFESSEGIAPVVTHRSVYYDFPAGIARTDFYDALAEDQDLFSTVTAQSKSIIHDFNSGVQYELDPMSGKCTIDDFKATIGPINIKETGKSKMPEALEFFSLNADKISYNGQFPTRGYMANVYTALVDVTQAKTTKKYIYSWYFSTGRTQVVEKDVEKNVLLRMVASPVAVSKNKHFDFILFLRYIATK